MKAVIQRVSSASVSVDKKVISEIAGGVLVLLGVEQGDNLDDLNYLVKKTVGLRIFKDENQHMNLSIKDINGEVLKKMMNLGSKIRNIKCIIGPCINKKNYEVDEKFYLKFIKKDKKFKKLFMKKNKKKYYFSLGNAIKNQLIEHGVKNVTLSNKDTYIKSNNYYSHRRSLHDQSEKIGRMINIIGFRNNQIS